MPATTRIHRIAIGDSLRRSAARRPDKTALIEGERRLSYRALDAAVNRFAHYLLGLGLARGEAVLLPSLPAMQADAQFWGATASNRGAQVQVFPDRQAAMDWLLLEA